jgi:GntR family transcriptional regulator, transcriptional repressor for pyruvate dehydrogenase complex
VASAPQAPSLKDSRTILPPRPPNALAAVPRRIRPYRTASGGFLLTPDTRSAVIPQLVRPPGQLAISAIGGAVALRAIKRQGIHEGIVSQIRQLVAEGHIKPGDQLPSERELSEKLRVSRASVREAIRALESLGLVEIRIGAGTYVASPAHTLLSPLASVTLQQRDVLLDIFEARKTIEPEIAAFAARRAGAEEIERMEEILAEQARQIAAGDTGVEADTAFHALLAQAAKNKVFLKLNEAIVDSLYETRERSLAIGGRPARSLQGHREILGAIRARDAARARTAMLAHLRAIEQNVLPPRGAHPERRSHRKR